jgi:Fur family ferric uptake transcriptional regulator
VGAFLNVLVNLIHWNKQMYYFCNKVACNVEKIMEKATEKLLKNHDLRITKVRTVVLDYFHSQTVALSHADIEQQFVKEFDRVTLYRTLNTFLEKGLVHKVPDDSGVARYAVCRTSCSEHHHMDNHVHFKCEVCEKVECLHELAIPEMKVPAGYEVHSANLLIQGICNRCVD